MKKLFAFSIIVVLLISLGVCAKTKNEKAEVKSTDGTVINTVTAKKISASKNKDDSLKKHRKNRKQYLRYIKKINNAKDKKRLKERNLEFYNERLELKKHMLEQLNSEVKKGENQEWKN